MSFNYNRAEALLASKIEIQEEDWIAFWNEALGQEINEDVASKTFRFCVTMHTLTLNNQLFLSYQGNQDSISKNLFLHYVQEWEKSLEEDSEEFTAEAFLDFLEERAVFFFFFSLFLSCSFFFFFSL